MILLRIKINFIVSGNIANTNAFNLDASSSHYETIHGEAVKAKQSLPCSYRDLHVVPVAEKGIVAPRNDNLCIIVGWLVLAFIKTASIIEYVL
jgi:hypothetical protein